MVRRLGIVAMAVLVASAVVAVMLEDSLSTGVKVAAISSLLSVIAGVSVVVVMARQASAAARLAASRDLETRRMVKDLAAKQRASTLEMRESLSRVRKHLGSVGKDVGAARSGLHRLEWGPIADVSSSMERMERGPIRDISSGVDDLANSIGGVKQDIADLDGVVRDVRTASRDIQREQRNSYRQIEAYVGLVAALDLDTPLPQMRGTWALAPDTASFLVRTARELGTPHILELGSGVSTALFGAALAGTGGKVTSVDHLEEFARETSRYLDTAHVEHVVDVVLAELEPTEIDGESWTWYSRAFVDDLDTVDFVVVDGPPGSTGPSARYPALPILAPKLRPGSLIFLDDSAREEEGEIANRWQSEFPIEQVAVPKLEKGGVMFAWRGRGT